MLGVLMLFVGHSMAGGWRSTLFSGSVQGFPSYEEATEILDEFLLVHPHLISRILIGSSFEGREMFAYRLHNEGAAEECEKVLLTSLLHGREPVTLVVALYAIGSLLEEFAANMTEAQFLLSSRQLFVVPFMNPDAYALGSANKRFEYRKNRRPTCASNSEFSGVDLNRNFGFHWSNISSMGDPCGIEFAGSGPFSEPESAALEKFARKAQFVSAMHLHAYGEILTYPYNFNASHPVEDRHAKFFTQLAEVMEFPRYGPAGETLKYTTSGEATDWFYGELGVVAIAPEIGGVKDSFLPTRAHVEEIAEKNLDRIKYFMLKSGTEISAVRVKPLDGGWTLELVNTGLTEKKEMRVHSSCHESFFVSDFVPSCPSNSTTCSVCLAEAYLECRCFALQEGIHEMEGGGCAFHQPDSSSAAALYCAILVLSVSLSCFLLFQVFGSLKRSSVSRYYFQLE